MDPRPRAFTFIEIMIVIIIMAILLASIISGVTSGRERSDFKANQEKIINMFQTARTNALSGQQVGGLDVDYYKVTVATNSLTLEGIDLNGGTTFVDDLTLSTGVTIDTPFYVYYYAPNGKACFALNCPGGTQSQNFILSSEKFSSDLAISYDSGFVEVMGEDI